MDRREFLKASSCAVPSLAIGNVAMATPAQQPLAPFAAPVANWPGEVVWAYCLPCEGFLGEYRYLMSNGWIVRAVNMGGFRVDNGTGWKSYDRTAFDAEVLGRVMSLVRQDPLRGHWDALGAGWDT